MDIEVATFMNYLGRLLPEATIGDDLDGQVVIYTNLKMVDSSQDPTIAEGEFYLRDMGPVDPWENDPEPVTCDNCPARSEAGWGDTALCLDCEDPKNICKVHLRTFVGKCPLC